MAIWIKNSSINPNVTKTARSHTVCFSFHRHLHYVLSYALFSSLEVRTLFSFFFLAFCRVCTSNFCFFLFTKTYINFVALFARWKCRRQFVFFFLFFFGLAIVVGWKRGYHADAKIWKNFCCVKHEKWKMSRKLRTHFCNVFACRKLWRMCVKRNRYMYNL